MLDIIKCRLSPAVKEVLALVSLNSILFAVDTPVEEAPFGTARSATNIQGQLETLQQPKNTAEISPTVHEIRGFLPLPLNDEFDLQSESGPPMLQTTPLSKIDIDDVVLGNVSMSVMPSPSGKQHVDNPEWSDPEEEEGPEHSLHVSFPGHTLPREESRSLERSTLSALNLSQIRGRRVSVAHATEARVLSIDGGGIKGLMVLELLALMEAKAGKHTTELFDMVGGTSAGALIATLLTIRDEKTGKPKFTARSLKDALMKHYPNFFVTKWGSCCGIMKEKYKVTPARKILEKLAGHALFGDAIIPTFVTAFNVSGESKYHKLSILGSYIRKDSGKTVVDAALSSMSAPVFFKPHQSSDGNVYLDGGLIANNPSLMAYCQAKEHFQHSSRMVLLSMGAGSFDDHVSSRKLYHTGLIDVGPGLPDMFLQGQQSITQDVLRLMPDVSDFRIDPILEGQKIDLDDTSQKAMDHLSVTALRWWGDHPQKIDEILARVKRI